MPFVLALLFFLHAAYAYGALASWAGRTFKRLAWMRSEAVAGRVGEVLAAVLAALVYVFVGRA